MPPNNTYEGLSREDLLRLLAERDAEEAGGLHLTYSGQTPPWRIVRRVQPRRQRIEPKLSFGAEEQQAENLIVEGENLQAMVSLYKYRGQVDLILTDPPYNTGEDFRYNDKWDTDPNDPDLGALVPAEDGTRHTKWLRFMVPRLWMMREMLRPGGVLAICIDHRELYRLGLVLDQIFKEQNRLGIINWQKTTVKNDKRHISSTTEYVLVYAKREALSSTSLLDRSAKANARFGNPDNDPEGDWKQGDLCASGDASHPTMVYAIQSPFTGELHYPPPGRHWANLKARMKEWLEAWGSAYEARDLKDGHPKALVVKGAPIPGDKTFDIERHAALVRARKSALGVLERGAWPDLYFGHTGDTKPVSKVRLSQVKAGSVPTTFWVDEDDGPIDLSAVSWVSSESGRSREGIEELDRLVGQDHNFKTVKPLRLFRKIVQLWCPPSGIVLDPFAGSGTTAHAVLELNKKTESRRRFLLVEQGRPERGDAFARALTAKRVKRAITGARALGPKADPLPGGYRFTQLTKAVDGEGVLALEREEMLDLLLTSHWDQGERASAHLRRLPAGHFKYLFASNSKAEGFFLVWSEPKKQAILNREAFRAIAAEAEVARLRPPFHVYARICTYSGPNIEFYQIPNRILEKLGFNEALDPYGSGDEDARAVNVGDG